MNIATIRKALLSTLAASAVMASTPALAQSSGFSISFGSPGYQQGYGYGGYGYGDRYGYADRYGYGGGQLQYRAQALSQHVNNLAYSGRLNRREAQSLAMQLNQYRNLEWRYARNGLSSREYSDLDRRLDRIEYSLQRNPWGRW
jgi:hypothetical protein